MALPEIKDTTGTNLARYKMTRADGTTEEITLEFYPADDYVPGTPFNAATVNPWIKKINNHDLGPITDIAIPTSQFVESSDFEQYPYHVDVALAGLLSSDYLLVSYSPATLEEGCMAPQGQSLDGIMRLYAYELPADSIEIKTVLIERKGV